MTRTYIPAIIALAAVVAFGVTILALGLGLVGNVAGAGFAALALVTCWVASGFIE